VSAGRKGSVVAIETIDIDIVSFGLDVGLSFLGVQTPPINLFVASSRGTPARVRCIGLPVRRWSSTSARSIETAVDFIVSDGTDPVRRRTGFLSDMVLSSSGSMECGPGFP
jgi:hypothetical protein